MLQSSKPWSLADNKSNRPGEKQDKLNTFRTVFATINQNIC